MKRNILVVIAACLFLMNQAFAANFCSDTVIDEVGKLSSDQVTKVTTAASQLKSAGVDVRVRILSNMHGQSSLTALKDNLLTKCGSWRASNTNGSIGMKTDLFVIMISMKPAGLATFYGDGLHNKLGTRKAAITADIKAGLDNGKFADGIIAGLNDATDLKELKITQQDVKNVQINHATDVSGFASGFKWIIAIIAILLLVMFAVHIFMERERRRNAQRNAKTQRARCTDIINGFESPYAVLVARIKQSSASEAKRTRLLGEAESAKSKFGQNVTRFSAINRSNNDPDVDNLSVAEYEGMAQRYAEIADKLEASINALDDITTKLKQPEVAEPVVKPAEPTKSAASSPDSVGTTSSTTSGNSSERPHVASPAPTPASQGSTSSSQGSPSVIRETTVIHDCGSSGDFITGILVGQALDDDHHHHHDSSDDRRPAPATSRGEEVESSFGNASKGDGIEMSFGNAGRGDSNETMFDGADFGRTRDSESVLESRPSDCDCKPSDCKSSDCNCESSDCRPSDCDCAKSDCNCDCNCDCSKSD